MKTDRIDPQASPLDRLRMAGLRATGPRLAILRALDTDRRHPTAEMILEDLREEHPSLSLSTVYGTLESFLEKGLVRRISGSGERLRVESSGHEHDHAVCRGCGEVFDVDPDLVRRPHPPSELAPGLRVMKLYLEYDVLCSSCDPNN